MRSIKEISEETNIQYPQLLEENIVDTVFSFLAKTKIKLQQEGYKVEFIGKTRGEKQHVPEGFVPHNVGNYFITGVSHDALWVNDKQYDFVGSANDTQHPIFDSNGGRIRAFPVANEVDRMYWRIGNPPVEFNVHDANFPPKEIGLKSRDQFYAELKEVNAFYASPDGLRRYGGMVLNEFADVEALGKWGYDLMLGKTVEECKTEIRDSFEWKAKH